MIRGFLQGRELLRTAIEFGMLVTVSAVVGQIFTLWTNADCTSWFHDCTLEWRLLHVVGSAFFFSSCVAVFLVPLTLWEWAKAARQSPGGAARPKFVRLRFWVGCNIVAVILMHSALILIGSKFGSG